MPSTLSEKLKEEFRQAYHYDGPVIDGADKWRMKASVSGLAVLALIPERSDTGEWVEDVAWVFEQGLFPNLQELFEIDGRTIRWSEGVSEELRLSIREFTNSIVERIHSYRVPLRPS